MNNIAIYKKRIDELGQELKERVMEGELFTADEKSILANESWKGALRSGADIQRSMDKLQQGFRKIKDVN